MNAIHNQSFPVPHGSAESDVHTSFKGQTKHFIIFCLKLSRCDSGIF